jgi:hypothetical protein
VYYEIAWPEFGLALPDGDIRKQVAAFMETVRSPRDDCSAEAEAFCVRKDEDGRVIPFEFSASFDLSASRPGLLSLDYQSGFFEGGMNRQMMGAFMRSYDLGAQKILRLDDVFPQWEDAKQKLLAELRDGVDEDGDPLFFENCREEWSKGLAYFPPDAMDFILYPGGLALNMNPGHASECDGFPVGKKTLEKIGADMGYWEQKDALRTKRE